MGLAGISAMFGELPNPASQGRTAAQNSSQKQRKFQGETGPVADIFQEVEEDVRRERAEKLWKRFAPLVLGVAVAIVLVVAGVTGWRHYVASERAESSDKFNAAVAQAIAGDRTGAVAALGTLAQKSREPYATLARLRQAALLAEGGDKAAAATFADAAAKADDPLVKQYAELMSVVQGIGSEDPDAVISRLEPMAADGRPWRNLARDYLAFVAFKKGDIALARRNWEAIVQDEQSAPSQKGRATELLTVTSNAASENKGSK